jgi:acetolactate synthase-1/3 small subunit
VRHTISILTEDHFGVLSRVAGMFSGRGFNIDSLNVGPTHQDGTSRMTIVVHGDDNTLEQVIKQLDKLVDVIEVIDFRESDAVERELVMLRVKCSGKTRADIVQMCDIFRAKIVDVQASALIIEVTGTDSKVTKFISLMEPFGIVDLSRTGRIALKRE